MKNLLASRIPPEIRQALRQKKRAAEARGRDFKLKTKRQVDPRNIERQFAREIKSRVSLAQELVENDFIPTLEGSLREQRQLLPTNDSLSDDVFLIINGIKIRFLGLVGDTDLRAILRNVGLAVNAHNLSQFRGVFKTALSVDPFSREAWLKSQIDNFVEQNVALIKSVDDRYFNEIQEVVFRGARQGLTAKDIAKNIAARSGVSKRRAELIARDQVNKFNGQLNQLRQQEVGVTRYRWRTSLDERVRSSHQDREGKIFSWDKPPSDGNPGEPINCRCYAEPIIEDLLDE